ncbi:MAG: Ribonuclease P protein component 1 [Candidatus Bathyarchaeota archaeon BA1]|nr:MAG: Ribonuclease P protein component 1 [Candidatus Bathyarchaeota archaeon BA1]
MRVTPAMLQHELIGLNARVVKSLQTSYVGIAGKVIDETRNTLVIQHKDGRKIILKSVAVFHFTMPDGTIVEIDGKAIVGRPEDRVKRRFRRRW